MVIFLLLLLAAVPLVGIGWILLYGSVTTVDGLFMTLILLTMSGIVGTTALFELKNRRSGGSLQPALAGAGGYAPGAGEVIHRGKVQEVVFYESNVGQPNKSVVTLADGAAEPQTVVVEGDMRNALPVGQKVQIFLRKEGGQNVLINLRYS
jgi:hypothetical protein